MKLLTITTIAFGLFACNNLTDKKTVENETKKDSISSSDKFPNNKINNNSNNFNCNYDKFLNDPKTPKLAKDLFNNTAKNPIENEPLAYFDNFKSEDKQEREFYFKAVTNSYKIADGAYSEGLGYTAKNYVENFTKDFASFFDNKSCFTDHDLDIWANILVLEFAIDSEGEFDKPIIEQFINKLKSNCKDCSSTQKETINKFDLIVNKKWNEYIKNISK